MKGFKGSYSKSGSGSTRATGAHEESIKAVAVGRPISPKVSAVNRKALLKGGGGARG